jgi:hypothetical protein
MKLNNIEKKLMKKRLSQLRKYMVSSLSTNKLDDYLNFVNSRELRMLENFLIKDELTQMLSIRL